jgi:hypothetical protein
MLMSKVFAQNPFGHAFSRNPLPSPDRLGTERSV